MEQLSKMLKRLTKKERGAVKKTLQNLGAGELKEMDIAPIRGKKGVYRIRIGSLRLIVVKDGKAYRAKYLFRRGKNTYKNL